MTLAETLNAFDEAWVVARDKRLGWIMSKIQESGYWVGGEDGGYTNDSNVYFATAEEAESYYRRTYVEYFVFDDEDEANDKYDEAKTDG